MMEEKQDRQNDVQYFLVIGQDYTLGLQTFQKGEHIDPQKCVKYLKKEKSVLYTHENYIITARI